LGLPFPTEAENILEVHINLVSKRQVPVDKALYGIDHEWVEALLKGGVEVAMQKDLLDIGHE